MIENAVKCIQAVVYRTINIYILARIRLLGRFTTYLAQTTTALRLLFALGWHSCIGNANFFGKFSSLNFIKNFEPL